MHKFLLFKVFVVGSVLFGSSLIEDHAAESVVGLRPGATVSDSLSSTDNGETTYYWPRLDRGGDSRSVSGTTRFNCAIRAGTLDLQRVRGESSNFRHLGSRRSYADLYRKGICTCTS